MFLEINNLKKSFGTGESRVEVLKGIQFSVEKGEICVLFGPSGSGKSTLLNILGLLDKPSSGELYLLGQPTSRMDDAGRTALRGNSIGFVFQFHHLIQAFTALNNVLMPLMLTHGKPDKQALERARELLAAVGLEQFSDRKPNELSGGQQQRVAIARALMMDPAILLFDEPTAALDPEITKEVAEIIRKLAGTGITQVVVTHEVEFARRVATQVIYLEQGQIVEMGSAQHFVEPQTVRFAEFLQH